MAKLEWDKLGEHWYETGTDRGVLYVYDTEKKAYGNGVAWNGLTAVNETPEGAEANDQYADNIKYLTLRSAETFGATIEAFTYPAEFEACDGMASLGEGVVIGQQPRTSFCFAYRTLKGNDTEGQNAGYKLHILYGCTVAPSERAYATVNDSPEAVNFSWELDTTPVNVTGHQPTACVTIDSTETTPEKMQKLEAYLYGTEGEQDENKPRVPMPDEIVGIMEAA